jgi:serine/threonine protein kinase/tetratricopeptide (TPR) repeat protein
MRLSKDELITLSRLLDEGLELPAEARESWLESLAEPLRELKPKLRELLARRVSAETDDFLGTLPKFTLVADAAEQAQPVASVLEGEIVGAYRLIREIGHGGMSTVWLAVRTDEQIKRPVALKLPHVHLNRQQFAERFARERDILAELTHPNIARLYDAGVTEAGQPFLAIEYIDGIPVTEYCDQRQLPIRARIDLFLQILGAVQYAHSHLVIHRDLKPSNILVARDGQVTLLDFGIAKLVTDGVAPETRLTLLGGRALTPDYASPEQIGGEPLSTSSDVYSLGVVLYELFTGARPYRLERDSRGALEDAILSGDPLRPSQAAIDASRAQGRATTVKKIRSALNGDLDTIVVKALKRHPAERYVTVDALRQDLERFLAGLPVLAQPDSAWYRTRKFVSRHKLGVVASTVVVGALAGGLAAVSWQARIARTEAATSRAVQDFLEDIFKANAGTQDDPIRGRQTTARQLLDTGASKIDKSLADAPAAKLRVLATLADMYHDLGLIEQSVALNQRRVLLAKGTYGPNNPEAARALIGLGEALASSQEVGERDAALAEAARILDHNADFSSATRGRLLSTLAEANYDRDAAMARKYAELSVQVLRGHPPSNDLEDALVNLAAMYGFSGDAVRAESAYEEALTISKRLHAGADSSRPQIYTYLGDAQQDRQEYAKAESSYRAAVQEALALGDENGLDAIRAGHGLGLFLFGIGKTEEGLALMADAKDRILKTRGPEDSLIAPWILTGYARALTRVGRMEEALDYLGQAERNQRQYRPGAMVLALVLEREALALSEEGLHAEAIQHLDEAAAIHTAIHDQGAQWNDHVLARTRVLIAAAKPHEARVALERFVGPASANGSWSGANLALSIAKARLELADGDSDSALRFAGAARVQLVNNAVGSFYLHEQAEAAEIEGQALLMAHRAADARPLLAQGVALTQQLYDPARSPELADDELALGNCLLDLGQRDEASLWFSRAEAILSKHPRLGEQFLNPARALEARLHRQKL